MSCQDDGVDSRTPFTPGHASCTSWASRSTKLTDVSCSALKAASGFFAFLASLLIKTSQSD